MNIAAARQIATAYARAVAEIAALYCPASPAATDTAIAELVRADARAVGADLNVWAALYSISDSLDYARRALAEEEGASSALDHLRAAREYVVEFDRLYPDTRPAR